MAKTPDNSLLTTDNAINAARLGIGFVPGGTQVRAATGIADAGLAFVQGRSEAAAMTDAEYQRLSEMLEADLRREAKHSRSLKSFTEKTKDYYKTKPWSFAATAVAATAAGIGVAMLFAPTGPLALVAGGLTWLVAIVVGGVASIAASYLTSSAFDYFAPRKTETPVEVVSQLHSMQQGGQQVTSEAVFVALVGNLREKDKEKIRDDLYKLTGKRSTGAALAAGENEALRKLMIKYDSVIRADTGALTDSNNPNMTTAEQYAAVINNGQLDARTLLFRDGRLPTDLSGSEYYATSGYLPPPETPGAGRGSPARG